MHTLSLVNYQGDVQMVRPDMSALLAPWRISFGVRGGGEAVIHVARCYVLHLPPGYAPVKLDFKNAFNSVHRYKMLKAVLDLSPRIYQCVYSASSTPSSLFWRDETLQSIEGVQQGDPRGLLYFVFLYTRFSLSNNQNFSYFT